MSQKEYLQGFAVGLGAIALVLILFAIAAHSF